MATSQARDMRDAYAVVRLDSFRNFTPRPENVTVRKVVQRLAEAEYEVRHLNATAPTGTVYFIQRTRVIREHPPAHVAASSEAPAPAAIEQEPPPPASPRSRRARAEKKSKKKKKKGRR